MHVELLFISIRVDRETISCTGDQMLEATIEACSSCDEFGLFKANDGVETNASGLQCLDLETV